MADKDRRWAEREPVAGASVEIDGVDHAVSDWSAGGFLVTPYAGNHRRGNRVKVRFRAPLGDGELSFNCRAIVIRAAPEEGELAAKFVALDGEIKRQIAEHFGFHTRRWRL